MSFNANDGGMTLVEMLAKEPSLSHLNGSDFVFANSISESQQHIQRQNGKNLSVKKINRPSSVPSTKKFEDYGVSSVGKINKQGHLKDI